MTPIDFLKKQIAIDDLSKDEQNLLWSELETIYPDYLCWIDNTPEAFELVESNIKKIIKPVKMMRMQSNIKIFTEFRRYCNELYPDKPFYDYLVIERQLPVRKLLAFKIFFVIDYFKVNNHLKKMFDLADLQRSGLYSRKDDGKGNLIFYNHRIIIPYISKGEITYLRGRYFDRDCNSKPAPGNSKYIGLSNDTLNLNQTKRFFNSDVLKHLFEGERLMIVEGELDTVAGESLGINTIGIPGVSNIPQISQFKKLLSYEIILCGDNDNAGNELIEKITNIFMDLKKEITIKQLNSKDLNEFIAA